MSSAKSGEIISEGGALLFSYICVFISFSLESILTHYTVPSANNGPKFNELHLKFPMPLHCDIFPFFNRIYWKYIRKYLLKIPEIQLKT